jgi:hypothetical protein
MIAAMRRGLLVAATIVGLASCAGRASRDDSTPTDEPAGASMSAVIVHGDFAGVRRFLVGPAPRIVRGMPSTFDGSSALPVVPEAAVARVPCRTGEACQLVWQDREGRTRALLVFATEPRVEVDVGEAGPDGVVMRARYRDRAAESAALGAIADAAWALRHACSSGPADHRGRARALQTRLRTRARTDPRAHVRESAVLALAEGRCVPTGDEAGLAAAVRAIDPGAASIATWPRAFVLGSEGLDPPRRRARIEAAIASQPDLDVRASLLAAVVECAVLRGDDREREAALDRLRDPAFEPSAVAWIALQNEARRTALRIAAGDPFPEVALHAAADEAVVEPADLRGAPVLWYFVAVAGTSKRDLPSLRAFAAAHPGVHVVVIVMDHRAQAPHRLLERHAPIPGTIVQPDETARATIETAVFSSPVFPSFVLTDAEGRVAATSNDATLEELDALVGGHGAS